MHPLLFCSRLVHRTTCDDKMLPHTRSKVDGSQTEATMLQVYPVGPVVPSPTLPTPTCALSRQPTRDGRQRTSSRPHANPDRGERGRARLLYDSADAPHSGRLHSPPSWFLFGSSRKRQRDGRRCGPGSLIGCCARLLLCAVVVGVRAGRVSRAGSLTEDNGVRTFPFPAAHYGSTQSCARTEDCAQTHKRRKIILESSTGRWMAPSSPLAHEHHLTVRTISLYVSDRTSCSTRSPLWPSSQTSSLSE